MSSAVTPYIAGYAAILSTWVAARAFFRDRPKMRVTVMLHVHGMRDDANGEYLSRESMGVVVSNVGDRHVDIVSVVLETWEHDNLHPVWADWVEGNTAREALPRGLDADETAYFFFVHPETDVIGASCRTAAGGVYRGKRFAWNDEILSRWYGLVRRSGVRPAVYTAKIARRRQRREIERAKRLGLPYYESGSES